MIKDTQCQQISLQKSVKYQALTVISKKLFKKEKPMPGEVSAIKGNIGLDLVTRTALHVIYSIVE